MPNDNRAKNGLYAHSSPRLGDPPPNSVYWVGRMKGAAKLLKKQVGQEAYQKLVDLYLTDAMTAKEVAEIFICLAAQAGLGKLDQLLKGETL